MVELSNKEVAEILFPLYKTWHIACLKDFRSQKTMAAEHDLWIAVRDYPDRGLPTKITASVGRWCAKQMKLVLGKEEWYNQRPFT